MRLERHDNARGFGGASGRQHGGDLGGVMAVVVDHADAIDDAAPFEAALGAVELSQRGSDLRERHVQFQANGHGRQGIAHGVHPGDRQRHRPQFSQMVAVRIAMSHRASRPEAGKNDPRRADVVGAINAVGDDAAGEARQHL